MPVSKKRSLKDHCRENLMNTKFLAFNQTALRLRHLTKIVAFNLTCSLVPKYEHSNPLPSSLPRSNLKSGYYFSMESLTQSSPDYVGELKTSNCPIWETFDCSRIFPVHLLSRKGILIRVWFKDEAGEEHLVTSWGVHFSGLVPVSLKPSSTLEYDENTLLFKIGGRYYTSYDCLVNVASPKKENLFEFYNGFSLPLSEMKPSYSVSLLCRLHGTQRAQVKEELRKCNFSRRLESKGVKMESKRIKIQSEIEDMKIRIGMLRNQLESQMSKLKSINKISDKLDWENQDHGVELLEGYRGLNRHLITLKDQETKINEDSEHLKQIISKVKERRCHLLSQLSLVFPVEKMEDGIKYSICGVCLPDAERYGTYSDQSLSVALGFVSQLLVKIAFLVNIPLKYPITLSGSQTSIADRISSQLSEVETSFPLYTRGKEREKLHFNYGVFLLNKSIAQLRWSCGMPTSDLRATLYNVWTFLFNLHDTIFSQPRAFMPDISVPSIVLPVSLRHNIETPCVLLQHESPNLEAKGKAVLHHLPYNRILANSVAGVDTDVENNFASESVSDHDCPVEHLLSDGTQSDVEISYHANKTLEENTFSLKNNEQQKVITEESASKFRTNSFSLDQGLNSIEESQKRRGNESFSNSCLISKIQNLSSNSFPNLFSVPSYQIDSELGSQPNLHEQTTQLLRSWHQDNPSPYKLPVNVFSSSEQLDNEDDIEVSPNGQLHTDKISPDITRSEVFNSQSDSKITENHILNEKSTQSFQIKLVEEMGISLSDIGIEEDFFLDDVASRTANLASQNCSFKLSFSKPANGC